METMPEIATGLNNGIFGSSGFDDRVVRPSVHAARVASMYAAYLRVWTTPCRNAGSGSTEQTGMLWQRALPKRRRQSECSAFLFSPLHKPFTGPPVPPEHWQTPSSVIPPENVVFTDA
jgi:hypothetical protein